MARKKKERGKKILYFPGSGSLLGLGQEIKTRAEKAEEFPYSRYATHRLAVFMPVGASSDALPRAWRERRKRRRSIW